MILFHRYYKLIHSEGNELPSGDRIKVINEKNGCKYLGTVEADDTKNIQVKVKLRLEYVWRVKRILRSHLNSRNVITAISARAVSIIRYRNGIIEWTEKEIPG